MPTTAATRHDRFRGGRRSTRYFRTRSRHAPCWASRPAAGWFRARATASALSTTASPAPGTADSGSRRTSSAARTLLSTLLEPELIGKLDPTTLCLRTLAVLEDGRDAGAALCHTVAKTGFPFRHRDFVDVTAWKRLPDGTVLQAARSCPTAAASVPYVLAPAAAGGTDLTLVSQTDLAGYMPTPVTNRRAAVSSQHSAQSRLPPHALTHFLAAGWLAPCWRTTFGRWRG